MEAGVMLMGGLLALSGCGGSVHVVTRTVTAPAKPSTPATPKTPTAPAAPTAPTGAAASTLGSAAIADAAEEIGSGVGDAALAPAVLEAAARPPTSTRSAAVTPTAPAVVPTRVISGHATGQYAVAHTNGTFRHPTQIVLNIAASPAQTGSVFWAIVCTEDGGGVGRKQAQLTVQLPSTETLPLPAPSSSCIASANVQLSKSGSVTLSITG
jgi:hypothetical protein